MKEIKVVSMMALLGVASAYSVLSAPPPSCDPAPSGIVAWWPGQGNADDIIGGNNGTAVGPVGYTNGEVGLCFSFNGTDYLVVSNQPALNPTNALTVECWACTRGPSTPPIWTQELVTKDPECSGTRQYVLEVGDSPVHPGTPDFRADIWVPNGLVELDGATMPQTNTWYHVAMTYDGAALKLYVNGVLDAQTAASGCTPYYLNGLVDEPTIYNRALSSNEIAAIYAAGTAGKCPPAPMAPVIIQQPANLTVLVSNTAVFTVAATGTAPLSYQWYLNQSNLLAGATNATLTLTDVQLWQAGNYSVLISNVTGSTNSAVATLAVVLPPVIARQPLSQAVASYSAASFTVAAAGTGPLSYQWQKNGTNLVDGDNISGSTTTNLNLASVTLNDAGNYDVVVSNPYASTTSSVAVLTVPQTGFALGSAIAMSGTTVTVPVAMNALEVENTFLATVGYDPTKLVFQSMQLGAATAAIGGTYLEPVTAMTNSGLVGYAVLLDTGLTMPAGTNEPVVLLTFQTLPVTSNTTVNLYFTNSPTLQQTFDNNIDLLPTVYTNGTLTLLPAEYEADVWPRTNGDHQVTVQDWLEEGRMVAGLDTPTNQDEFNRADCAPRNAPDGVLTVADWDRPGATPWAWIL